MMNFENAFEKTGAASFETPEIFQKFENFQIEDAEMTETVDAAEALEEAPSMEIQAMEIRDYFIEKPELQYENWKELDEEERLAALNDLEKHVAEIAKRPPMEVGSERMEPGLRGYYRYAENKMWMNRDLLMGNSEDDYRTAIQNMLHEGRHAYQYYNVFELIEGREAVESDRVLLNAWSDNICGFLGGYKDSDEKGSKYIVSQYRQKLASDGFSSISEAIKWVFPPYSDLGYEEYHLQPIEVDARTFAAQVVSTIGI